MPARILVIDDEVSVRDFLVRFLARQDYAVDVAKNGVEAIDLARHHDYDAWIVDLRLPDIDGLDLIQQFSHVPAPKIVLTGAGSIEDAIEAVNRGAYDFVQKPIRDLDGFSVTVRNAVERKRLLEESSSRADQLARAEQMSSLGQMVASIAHELRNPLISIGGYARLIMRNVESESAKFKQAAREIGRPSDCMDYARIIMDESQRLDRMVRDLLEFANLRRPEFTEIRLRDCFRNAARLFGPQMEIKSVTLADFLDPHTAVYADSQQLEQVFINLIQNSIEAMAEGGAIQIREEVAGEYVDVHFTDTGSGIGPDVDRGALFTPFFTTKAHGSGLGLAVTRQIMQNHQGSVEVEQSNEHGTTFLLRFPRVLELVHPAPAQQMPTLMCQ